MPKPRVAILGKINNAEISPDLPFEFTQFGYAHTVIPQWGQNSQSKEQLATDFDLIIIQDLGGGCWNYRNQLEGLKGHRAKIVFWSFDSHHEHQNEKANADLFDAIATAHSWTVPLIGPTAFWCPCSLVFHTKNDFPSSWFNIFQGKRWLDWGFIGRRYAFRESILNRWREWFECLNHSVFCGESDIKSIPGLYTQCRASFNVTYSDDLNIRFFEALAAGCPLLMTDCQDAHQSRFEDLMPYVKLVPRDIDYPAFSEAAHKVLEHDAANAPAIIFQKHTLIHRFIEIAEYVL